MQNPKNKRKNGIIFKKKTKKHGKQQKMKKICKIFKKSTKKHAKTKKKTHYGYIPKKA